MTETYPQNRILGYARVGTYGQTLDAQLEQLCAAGCTKIYREKVTGARADRRKLLKLLHALAPGDVVTVTRIDRWHAAPRPVRHRQADRGREGAIPLTGGAVGRYPHQHRALDAGGIGRLGRCVERDLIRPRTAEGRSRAKAQGKQMGHPRHSPRRSRTRPPDAVRRAR